MADNTSEKTDPMWARENYGEAALLIDELEAEVERLRAKLEDTQIAVRNLENCGYRKDAARTIERLKAALDTPSQVAVDAFRMDQAQGRSLQSSLGKAFKAAIGQ